MLEDGMFCVCRRQPQPTVARQFTFGVIVCTFLSLSLSLVTATVNFTFTYKKWISRRPLVPTAHDENELYNEDVAARRAFTLHFVE